ncbi:MAG: efflux RND transporter periplasmic adaptor subunit [Nitrospinae bacterium]|nr:efflux RND transporter periplasmic adaptor subunit [Nitrospinota bacterium]
MKHRWVAVIAVLVLGGFACAKSGNGPISASGTIEAVEVTVNAKTGGTVTRLAVAEGSEVKKGDQLALVDSSTLEIQLKQAQANVEAAEAQSRLAQRGYRTEDVQQAEANFAFARAELERAETLFPLHSITQKQYDDAKARFTVAQKAYEKMKAGLLPEERDTARARARLAHAQADQIRKMIRDAEITAPVDGVVTQKSAEEGDDVLPNAQLFRISRLNTVYLMIYVNEVELASVKLGQEANVFIDAFPGKPFKGRVTYISPVAEFTPKNVQTKDDRTKLVFGVKVEVPNADYSLKPGMPADAELIGA